MSDAAAHQAIAEADHWLSLGGRGQTLYEGHPAVICRRLRDQLEARLPTGEPTADDRAVLIDLRDDLSHQVDQLDAELRILGRLDPSAAHSGVGRFDDTTTVAAVTETNLTQRAPLLRRRDALTALLKARPR